MQFHCRAVDRVAAYKVVNIQLFMIYKMAIAHNST